MTCGQMVGVCVIAFTICIPFAGGAGDVKKPKPAKKVSELRIKGMKDAVADVEKGIIKQKDYNDRPDSPTWPIYVELTKKECGVVWETVARDKVPQEYAGGYNDVMLAEIEHRFGRGIFEKLQKRAEKKK